MRGNPELAMLGGRRLPARRRSSSALPTYARCWRTSSATSIVHEVPPGVDVEEFAPASREDALRRLLVETRADPPNPGNVNERLPDEGNTERLAEFFQHEEPTGLFGKLLYNKGVHVLFEALRGRARAVVGFGDYRRELERTAPPGTLFRCPRASPPGQPGASRRGDGGSLDLPGGLRHGCGRSAAGGSLPLVARHSGLAEVATGLEESYPERHRELASFETGDAHDLADKLGRCWPCRPRTSRAVGRRAASRGRALELDVRGEPAVGALSIGFRGGDDYRVLLKQARGAVRGGAGLHRRRRGGVRDSRSGDACADEPLRGAAGSRRGHRARGAPVGELIASEVEIRTGRCDTFADVVSRIPERRTQLRALADRSESGSAAPAPIRGARGRSSASSTRRTTGGTTRSSSTSSGATTRSACTSTWRSRAPTASCR